MTWRASWPQPSMARVSTWPPCPSDCRENDSMPHPHPVALVTGAGRNIGREIALGLAATGMSIAVNVRSSAAEGQAVVDEITAAGGHAILCPADVTDERAVAAMLCQVAGTWGRLDVLVN